MKKEILALVVSLLVCFELCGQGIYPTPNKFQDGVVFFRVSDSFSVEHIPVLDDYSVDETYFPQLKEIFEKYGLINLSRPFAVYSHPVLLRIFKMNFSQINEIDYLVRDLEQIDFIVYVEKNPEQKSFWTPNDPFYGVVEGKNMRWHLDMINAEKAWDFQRGNSSIKVAIVDNFVWGEHPDLEIDPANQYNAANRTVGNASPVGLFPQDSSEKAYLPSHGTHSAGLVGGKNNNGIGIASIGGGVTLLGIRTADYNGNMYYTLEGVAWAVSQGAHIVSMSYGSTYYSTLGEELFKTYSNAGVVLVAAAGNEGEEGNPKNYPACYSSVISVASVNADATLSYFSQHGDTCADIAAPGGFIASPTVLPNILSTTYCKPYIFNNISALENLYYDGMQGTSMSCPITAGLCGLLLSAKPNLTPAQIKYYLQKSARPLNPNSQTNIGANGYIDALGALLLLDTNFFYATPQIINSTSSQSTNSVSIYAQNGWTMQQDYPNWIGIDTAKMNDILVQAIITIEENTSIFPRTATLFLHSVDLDSTITITINQEAAFPVLEVDKEIVRISQEKDKSSTLSIKSNVDWTINGIIPDWLLLSDVSGMGDKKITFTATDDNTTGSPLSCTFTLEGTSVPTILLTVYQMDETLSLALDKSSVLLSGNKGAKDSIYITSNTDWSIAISDTMYASFTPQKGFGDQQVIITALLDNTTFDVVQRIATVEGNGTEDTHLDIMQQPGPFCNLSASVLNLGNLEGDTASIDVFANIPWTVLSNTANWVSLSTTSGSDSARIICTATADNTTASTRSTNFQIRTNISLKTFRVNQLPADDVGIADFSTDAISINPNPSENYTIIKSKNLPITQIRVTSIEGKTIKEAILGRQAETALDISGFAKGIYFLQVRLADGSSVMKKLVKK